MEPIFRFSPSFEIPFWVTMKNHILGKVGAHEGSSFKVGQLHQTTERLNPWFEVVEKALHGFLTDFKKSDRIKYGNRLEGKESYS
jgi:hypothetical protein